MRTELTQSIPPANLPLTDLARNKQLSEAQKVKEAGRQFEAILLRQVLTAAQKPVLGAAGANSGSSEFYKDMILERLADSISRSGAIGFGNALTSQLSRSAEAKVPATESGC